MLMGWKNQRRQMTLNGNHCCIELCLYQSTLLLAKDRDATQTGLSREEEHLLTQVTEDSTGEH